MWTHTKRYPQTTTIANGTSTSNLIDAVGLVLVGLIMSDNWTAAPISFLVGLEGTIVGDAKPLYFLGSEFVLTSVAADRAISIDPVALLGWPAIYLRSGTLATPVNQGANRQLTVILRPL